MATVTNKNKSKNTDSRADELVVEGTDPFNGEVLLFRDGYGYWIENWRTCHYSEYLHDENGKLITDETAARGCFDKEISNAQWVGAIYP